VKPLVVLAATIDHVSLDEATMKALSLSDMTAALSLPAKATLENSRPAMRAYLLNMMNILEVEFKN
jgi:hypothetical protein